MTTVKSYTDVAQSKTLSNILPSESADGTWVEMIEKTTLEVKYRHSEIPFWLYSAPGLPSWSLAALLDVLPKIHKLKPILDLEENSIQYSGIDLYIMADNPVDACYELILKLHELKML